MTWTNSPPTVPGWYWCRAAQIDKWVVQVVQHPETKELGHWFDKHLFSKCDACLSWSGPIPEPQEPPSGTQK